MNKTPFRTEDEKRAIALEVLSQLAAIHAEDSTALLSSTLYNKGQAGDSNAAFVALVSAVVELTR